MNQNKKVKALPKSRLNIPVRRTPKKDPSAMVKNANTLLTRAVIVRVSPKLQSTEEEVRRLSSKLSRNLDKVYEDRNDGA